MISIRKTVGNILSERFRNKVSGVFTCALFVLFAPTVTSANLDAYPDDPSTNGVRLVLESIDFDGRASVRVFAGSNASLDRVASVELGLTLSPGASLTTASKSGQISSWTGPVIAPQASGPLVVVYGDVSEGFLGEQEVLQLEIQVVDGDQQIIATSGYLNENEYASDLPFVLRMPNDTDGDFVPDDDDAFPNDPAASIDTDLDGQPDDWNPRATESQIAASSLVVDLDDDNDGFTDEEELAAGSGALEPSSNPEKDALVALYTATSGDTWNRADNWLESENVCDWFGVTCTEQARVSALELPSNGLSGSLVTELGNLKTVTSLNLADNQLVGGIPSNLGSLSNLEYLRLHVNKLSGPIPAELGNLSQLGKLNLAYNQLTGSIPPGLGNLQNLWALNLDNNQLTGSIPDALGQLPLLQYLLLNENDLSGQIPASLGQLSQLLQLNLAHNQLVGPIPAELGALTNLTALNLDNNQFAEFIPELFGQLSSLRYLLLHNNQFSGQIPASIGQLKQLLVLNLAHNELTGDIPTELGAIEALVDLSLGANSLSGAIPGSLGSLAQLSRPQPGG